MLRLLGLPRPLGWMSWVLRLLWWLLRLLRLELLWLELLGVLWRLRCSGWSARRPATGW